MIIDTDHLVNQIHAEVEGVAETGFPMDVFPERIQKIIYDLVTYENYNLEYTASIILSAYATAIGNTYHVKIKGNWVSSCALFMILVGRPGLGKTPPLGFLYQITLGTITLYRVEQCHHLVNKQHDTAWIVVMDA